MGRLTLISWILTVAISYFSIGGTLSKLVEGWDPAGLPRLPLVAAALAVTVSLTLTLRWCIPRSYRENLENRQLTREAKSTCDGF